jgi:hypothetical protein
VPISALTDCQVFLDKYDLTSRTNEVTVEAEVDELESTTFASAGNREYAAGLRMTAFDIKGFLDFAAGQSEEALASTLGVTGSLLSVSTDDAAGSTAVFAKSLHGKLTRSAPVGQLVTFGGTLKSDSPHGAVEGKLLVPKRTDTSGSTTTGVQFSAVGASQVAYAILHVFAATGTLTVTLQSDDNADFSSPTGRISFAAASAASSEWKSAAGAITDTHWRASFTLPSGSATWAVVLGIK